MWSYQKMGTVVYIILSSSFPPSHPAIVPQGSDKKKKIFFLPLFLEHAGCEGGKLDLKMMWTTVLMFQ